MRQELRKARTGGSGRVVEDENGRSRCQHADGKVKDNRSGRKWVKEGGMGYLLFFFGCGNVE